MKRVYSIKKTQDIDAIFNHKKSVGNSYFAVYTKTHENSYFKYAISIGRKYGSAVERNLAKRRIRSIILSFKEIFKVDERFVIVVKPSVKKLKYSNILMNLEKLFTKANLIKKEE